MKTTTILSNNWKLAICILICQSVGIISGLLTNTQNNAWYDTIVKPSWNPPGYLFGPVWTTLYLLMAISLWIVWKSNSNEIVPYISWVFFATILNYKLWVLNK